MLPTNQAIKHTAKSILKQKWPQAIGACGIYIGVGFLGTFLEQLLRYLLRAEQSAGFLALFRYDAIQYATAKDILLLCGAAAYGFLIQLPLLLGSLRWFWRMAAGIDETVACIFYYFSTPALYVRTLVFALLYALRATATAFVAFLPAAAINLLGSPRFYRLFSMSVPLTLSSLSEIAPFFYLLGVAGFVFWMLRYSLAPVLLLNDDTLRPNQSFGLSNVILQGFRCRLFSLLLSFIGWWLLCLFAVPALYVLPYFLTTFALFSRYVIFAHNRRIMQRAGADVNAYRPQNATF